MTGHGSEFRAVMRRYPTGVTIVTTVLAEKLKGFTANAFSSVSVDPPTVLICVNRNARTHPIISQAGHFCVNLLRLDQRELAERFARGDAGADPFANASFALGPTGSPIFDGVLGYFDCELAEEHSAGTHTIFLGNVVACGSSDGAPLGYFDGSYRDFGCATP